MGDMLEHIHSAPLTPVKSSLSLCLRALCDLVVVLFFTCMNWVKCICVVHGLQSVDDNDSDIDDSKIPPNTLKGFYSL